MFAWCLLFSYASVYSLSARKRMHRKEKTNEENNGWEWEGNQNNCVWRRCRADDDYGWGMPASDNKVLIQGNHPERRIQIWKNWLQSKICISFPSLVILCMELLWSLLVGYPHCKKWLELCLQKSRIAKWIEEDKNIPFFFCSREKQDMYHLSTRVIKIILNLGKGIELSWRKIFWTLLQHFSFT